MYEDNMSEISRMFAIAAKVAIGDSDMARNFWLGAVGRRRDGAIVTSRNGPASFGGQIPKFKKLPGSHAESRLCKKMDTNGEVYVVRVSREHFTKTNKILYKNARPCEICQQTLRSRRVKKVYYTAGEDEFGNQMYGVWDPLTDKDTLYKL
jgi:deoxycytidylate deaminase